MPLLTLTLYTPDKTSCQWSLSMNRLEHLVISTHSVTPLYIQKRQQMNIHGKFALMNITIYQYGSIGHYKK